MEKDWCDESAVDVEQESLGCKTHEASWTHASPLRPGEHTLGVSEKLLLPTCAQNIVTGPSLGPVEVRGYALIACIWNFQNRA